MKLFLNENSSYLSNNVEGVVNTTLSTKNCLLGNNDITTTISLLDQYNKERDNCKNFRLIFNINPVCSNVLFNFKSEIVLNEGSDETMVLHDGEKWEKSEVAPNAINSKNKISYLQAIRDTEYSHPQIGNFVYHCGLDIFNNHMLRNKGFVHVNKSNDKTDVYNTIEDFSRYADGEIVSQNIDVRVSGLEDLTEMHLYRYDNIHSFKNAFSNNCKEKDGWWGFINPGNININNRDIKTESGNTIMINQMLSNNKPCEFIDLYPDRTLFSFNPKYNKFRRRIEKNWDYCITYPERNDHDIINEICGGINSSIRINCKKLYNTNNIEILQCESYFKHNLNVGDFITLFYKDDNGFQKLTKKIKVVRVGDLTGRNSSKIFSIKFSDIKSIYQRILDNNNILHFKKTVDGVECDYYLRIFKKIDDLNSEINKVAFGKNIYGDDTSQIIFTDDIDINNLVDNNGRPLSEVYLTIIKRNAGYKKWYFENNFQDSEIEYSHCFGEVTSGLDFSGINDEPDRYNIHKIHNVKPTRDKDGDNTRKAWGIALDRDVETLEQDIKIGKNEFYGDVVEYDSVNAKETVISPIYHRFNTVQRELFDKRFRDLVQDVIVADDYDGIIGTDAKTTGGNQYGLNKFTIHTYWLNDIVAPNRLYKEGDNTQEDLMYGNICPEGYYYQPHYKVKLIEEDSEISRSAAKLVNYDISSLEFNNIDNTVVINVPTNFGFYKGDYIAFYNISKSKTIWGEIIKVINNTLTLKLDDDEILTQYDFIDASGNKIMNAYWSPDNVPTFGKLDIKNRCFTWRKLIPQSELNTNYDLYETPFTNGRLYIEKNINFFLRRQDPFGKYGLSIPIYKEGELSNNPLKKYIIKGQEPYDLTIDDINFKNYDNCY